MYSHIVYGIHVWGSTSDSELNKILILQKKAVRMMLFKDQYPQIPGPRNPSNPLFHELGILKVDDVFKFHVPKFVYECLSFTTPSLFWNWFTYNHSIHSYNTTSSSKINMKNHLEIENDEGTNKVYTKCSKLVKYGAKKIQVSGPLIWNNIPEYIRNSLSLDKFKQDLKLYFLDKYNSIPKQLNNHYYVSELSKDNMKITVSKMNTFFVPPYLPNNK